MNMLSRALTRVATSSFHSKLSINPKWLISQQLRFSTSTDREMITSFKKPEKIEYQQEISNWINLTGFVDQPVQFQSCTEGKFWAGTVISQRSGLKSSNFWIPIIFEGDLAKIAAQHVKKDDRIHISGKLFTDSPPPNVTNAQSTVQVMVHNLNFIPQEKEEIRIKKKPGRPKQVKVVDEETLNSWNRLFENPKEWLDHRGNIANGLVNPRHPDFKCKDGSLALWLKDAPDWVLPKLKGVEFDVVVPTVKPKLNQLKGEESWKDLVQNPDDWVDNRTTKTNARFPDFKHKESKEGLWMNKSPLWVLSKLPPLKKNQETPLMPNTISQRTPKHLKREELWKDVVENPDKWWDRRLIKTNEKAPDFVHRESKEGLWMDSCPVWLLSKLPPIKKNQERPVMA